MFTLGIVTYLEPRLIKSVNFPIAKGEKRLIIDVSIDCLDRILQPCQLLGLGDWSERDTRPNLISSELLEGV